MGWKTRRGRAYLYRSERVGGRVVSRQVGGGETALLISELGAIERDEREADRRRLRLRRERAEALSARVQGVGRLLNLVAEAILEASGYHRHHRGPWRRRRTMSDATALATKSTDPVADLATLYRAGDEAAREEVERVVDRAEKGDREAAYRVAAFLRAAPELADYLGGNVAKSVEDRMIRRAYGKDSLASREAARAKLAEVRAELAGPSPSAVERLLAERAALCWLDCHYADYLEVEAGSRSIAQADFTARQRDRAHRRYLSALKALAAVRKLPIVAVQVNLGQEAAREVGA